MPAGSTYSTIATQTLGSTASSVTFSSIPSTYTDLVLITAAPSVGGGISIATLTFNGDTASNYSFTRLSGDGSSASTDRVSNTGGLQSGLTYPGQYTQTWIIQSYANTSVNKTALNKSPVAQSLIRYGVGLWRSTAAITSVTIADGTGTGYATGATFTLYGITAA
jgi:hypothetical protein